MRRHRALGTSSAQSLCIVCAFRLSGQVAPVAVTQRRHLQSSRRPNQQATAQAPQQNPASEKPQWSFDVDSTLSPSEAREVERRARLRREREERDLAEKQRVQREEEQRQEERRIQQLQRQEAAQKGRQRQNDVRRAETERRQQSARDRNASQKSNQRRPHQQEQRRQPRGDNPFEYKSVNLGRDSEPERQTRSNVIDIGQESKTAARSPSRRDNRDYARSPFDDRARRPQANSGSKMQMPSFGGGTQTQESEGGWGRGNVDIKPLQYRTEEQIQEAKDYAAAKIEEERRARRGREEAQRRKEQERQQMEEVQRRAEERRRQAEASRRSQRESREQRREHLLTNAEQTPPWSQSTRSDHVVRGPVRSPGSQPFVRASEPDMETEYQATPFSSTDYQPRAAATTDASFENTWQHLGPRKQESRPPPSSPSLQNASESAAQRDAFPLDDDFTINRNFEQHRRQRDIRASSPSSNPNITDIQSTPQPEFVHQHAQKTLVCGRCLKPGHAAGQCPGPFRCRRCGEAGHEAKNCKASARRNRNNHEQCQSRPESQVSRALGMGEGSNVFRRAMSEPAEQWSDDRNVEGGKSQQRPGGPRVRFLQHDFEPREDRTNAGREVPSSGQRTVDFGEPRPKPQNRPDRGWAGVDREVEQDDPEEEADLARRARRRSRRGFAESEEQADEEDARKAFDRRRDGRRLRESEEDADDEAMAAREERAAKKAARKAQEKEEQEKRKAARASGQRAGGGEQVHLPEFVSVSNLAQQLGVGYEPFVQRLEQLGYDDVFPGKVLNKETSGMIAMEYDFDPVYEITSATGAKSEEEERDLKPAPEVEDTTFLPTRPPVVTIMGHVDHGKTTILDYLRRTSVAAGEAGGITQHIGAFSVPLSSSGRTITFLDTPGHAAFMSMRQRGANVTDIVILVVAADDSVKPQTLESIRCAREAGVPMIVAVNKVDKEEADVQRVKNDLARHGVEIEDFGGEVQVVEVSGKTGQGLDALEENIVTLSEILDHRSETEGAVEGWVLEATTKRAGRVATVLVRRGTLRPGAVLVAGKTWARVRTLRDERDQTVMEVGPGMPVEVDGWRDQPTAGDEVLQAPGEQKATDVVAYRLEKGDRLKMEEDMEVINESRRAEQERRKAAELAARAAADAAANEEGDKTSTQNGGTEPRQDQPTGQQVIPFIIKADVSGSAEAVAAYIPSLTSPLIKPDILASTVGAINESDVELASASNGHIIAFNLPRNEEMRGLAESKGVKVLENNIIYRTLEQVKELLEAKLPPVITQKVVGEADVGAVFEIGVGGRKKMRIAGCKVRNGVVGRNARARVWRGGEKVYDGAITSLKNVKKDVQEMRKGTECGMGFEGWEAFQEGDQIQTYEEMSEKRKL